jgi:hypothetical protein
MVDETDCIVYTSLIKEQNSKYYSVRGDVMKAIKLTVASFVAVAVMSAFSGLAVATTSEQEQSAEQKIEVKCTTGAYGQIIKCEAVGEQKLDQKQKLALREGRVLGKIHVPVDTALDFPTMALVGATLASGTGAFLLKRKIG